VWTSFVINEFGEIEDVKIERGLHKRIDEQVLQSFKNVPAMVPASQQGKKVRVMYSMPFKFETK
jgi:periplasmic protein TonB